MRHAAASMVDDVELDAAVLLAGVGEVPDDDPAARRRAVDAEATGVRTLRALLHDDDPTVRMRALGELDAAGVLDARDKSWVDAHDDEHLAMVLRIGPDAAMSNRLAEVEYDRDVAEVDAQLAVEEAEWIAATASREREAHERRVRLRTAHDQQLKAHLGVQGYRLHLEQERRRASSGIVLTDDGWDMSIARGLAENPAASAPVLQVLAVDRDARTARAAARQLRVRGVREWWHRVTTRMLQRGKAPVLPRPSGPAGERAEARRAAASVTGVRDLLDRR